MSCSQPSERSNKRDHGTVNTGLTQSTESWSRRPVAADVARNPNAPEDGSKPTLTSWLNTKVSIRGR